VVPPIEGLNVERKGRNRLTWGNETMGTRGILAKKEPKSHRALPEHSEEGRSGVRHQRPPRGKLVVGGKGRVVTSRSRGEGLGV